MDFPNWQTAVLDAIGAPKTKSNVDFLTSWHAFEQSNATNNPLNTTAYAPTPATVGTGAINNAGVQNYASPSAGVAATAAFLQMPNYSGILSALRSGDATGAALSPTHTITIQAELRKWGSVSFANNIAGGSGGTAAPVGGDFSTVGQAASNAASSVGGAVSNAFGDLNPVKWVKDLTTWASHEAIVGGLYVVLSLAALALFVLAIMRAGNASPGAAGYARGKLGAGALAGAAA